MSAQEIDPPPEQRRGRGAAAGWATIGLALALIAALVLLAAGPGHRFGWWPLDTGFALLRWAAYGGIAAAALSAAGLILAPLQGHRRGMFRALAGLALGLLVVGLPWSHLRTAQSVPPIHDITTDPDDPPPFDAILPLRADAPNPPDYGGTEVAAQQRAAYPDIAPGDYPVPPAQAFGGAVAAAEELGWEIVAADPAAGRIEATDTTFWFGFKDDVAIRIRPGNSGSRIDVRSKSRVGVGDVGTNAARIREFFEELEQQLAGAR